MSAERMSDDKDPVVHSSLSKPLFISSTILVLVMGIYGLAAGIGMHKLITLTAFARKIYARMSVLQYATMQIFLVIMLSLPVKILIRQLFRIKYVWVTPWFNV